VYMPPLDITLPELAGRIRVVVSTVTHSALVEHLQNVGCKDLIIQPTQMSLVFIPMSFREWAVLQ
jgi:hypothetical protein